ncbi:MAG: 2-oxoacid:acceptor oxidoreductase family protein [Candidatus Omnitrophota bacterium]|jgi:2-oxoglutarate ferredoxin oxidoreductase subunit gamma
MTERIIIAGAGGQGIMLLGKILATAAMEDSKFVTWLPSYGAEVRGGTAHCLVVVSDEEIGSPYIKEADTLIVLNSPSLLKFKNRLKDKGLLIANSSLVKAAPDKRFTILSFPFTDIASNLGNMRVANMAALGVYAQAVKIVSIDKILRVIEQIAPADKKNLIKINQDALKKGMRLVNG